MNDESSSTSNTALIACQQTPNLDVLLTLIRLIAAKMAEADEGAEGIANEMLQDDVAYLCSSIGLPNKGTKSIQDAISSVFRIMDTYSCPTELGAEQVASKYQPWDGNDVSLDLLLEEIDGECKIASDEETSEGSNSVSENQRRSPQASPPRRRNTIKNRLNEETLDALDQLLSEIPDKKVDTLEESKSHSTPPISNRSKFSASSSFRFRNDRKMRGSMTENTNLSKTKTQSHKIPSSSVFGFKKLSSEMEESEFRKTARVLSGARGRATTVRPEEATPSRTCVAKPRNRSISVESFGSSWEYLGDNHIDGGSGSSQNISCKSTIADPILSPGGEEGGKSSKKHKSFCRLHFPRSWSSMEWRQQR